MCKRSSLRSQLWMRLFLWFSNTVFLCRMLLKGVIERVVQYPDGAWQKIVFVVLADKSLGEVNVFECVVRIPDTIYRVTRTIIYTPSEYFQCFCFPARNPEFFTFFFQYWHFPLIFVLLKVTCLVTLQQTSGFKNSSKWTIFGIFDQFLSY